MNNRIYIFFKNWKLLTFFHCSRYVWYCPGWRASQYKLFCPENVADLLHLGFIFNFPSDWVENGGNRRDTSKREKEDEEIFRSWKTIRRIIHEIIHLNVLWLGSDVPNELFKIQLREIISFCYCPFVVAIVLFFHSPCRLFSKNTQPSGPLCPWQLF